MHRLASIGVALLRGFPSRLDDLYVFQLVEDAIAAEHNKVVVVFDL